jgi:DNA-binding NarL/FixJ family response regulator
MGSIASRRDSAQPKEMRQPSIDVLIMASSPDRRDRLVRLIGADHAIRLVGTAATFPFLRSLISEASADVAVIDLQSQIDSTTVREWISELLDRVAMIVLSAEADPAIFNRILTSRVGGMLSIDASSEQVVQAIRSVAAGLVIFDSAHTRHFMAATHEDNPAESLTPREREVLSLLADGLGNKEIAGRLDISEHTIKFHIRSILGKLGVSSRTEAVSRGLRSGLIEL